MKRLMTAGLQPFQIRFRNRSERTVTKIKKRPEPILFLVSWPTPGRKNETQKAIRRLFLSFFSSSFSIRSL